MKDAYGQGRRLSAAHEAAVAELLAKAVDEDWAGRVWARDTSVWTSDPSVAELIANRLGWLDLPTYFDDEVEELEAFAGGVKD
ncbi:MAG: hypothetical protein QFC55_03475 [Chloroflexota bacterium]|nr:hypothetical protein [Chloroflexota bacterium]